MLKLNFKAYWGVSVPVSEKEIKFSRLLLYSKQPMRCTKSLCILKGSLEVILSSQCVSRGLFPAKTLLFFGWYDVLWAVCAVARRCSWPIHPSSARSLSAARSSNLLFVWKPSIIFLSMTHWPKGIPSIALQECFSWYEVMCLCCVLKQPNSKKDRILFSG